MKIIPTVVVALLLCAGVNAFSQKTKVVNPGAVVKFGYCAAAPDPAACETSDRVRNDFDYPYTNGAEGVSAVFNLVSGSKDLTVGLVTSQRSLWLDFTDHVVGSADAPSWWLAAKSQNVKPFFNVLKAYRAKELCASDPCDVDFVTALNVGNWRASGSNVDYALLWNPGATARPVNSPETSSAVNVHYHKAGIDESFTITPIANNNGLVVAGLESTVRRSVTSAGQYIMPFTMTVTLQ
jgi:hypothetical protein